MSLFLNKDKTMKSPHIIYGFFLTLCFMVIFGILYGAFAELLHRLINIADLPILTGFLQCLVISVFGVAICCLFFLLKDKRLVPLGFAFLGLITILLYVSVLLLNSERQIVALTLVTLHFPLPAVLGNIIAWLIYKFYFWKNDKDNNRRLIND